jgi:hypothetical protein
MQQYCIGEQKQGMNLQQHKQHDSTIIPLGNNTPQRQGLFFKTIKLSFRGLMY